MLYDYFSTNLLEKQYLRMKKKFTLKKIENNITIQKLQTLKGMVENTWLDETSLKLKECATQMTVCEHKNRLKIRTANFCRLRICHVCAWRRQAKFVATTIPVLQELETKYSFLFVTLTLKNCKSEEVESSLNNLLKGWDRFLKLSQVKRMNQGYIRSLEMTYNKENNTYHPHIHALFVVKKSYFHDEKQYISLDYLIEKWKGCTQVNYEPNVHIETVKNNGTERKAYIETLKYAIKPQKEVEGEQLLIYINSLKGRRLVSFGGIVGKLRKLDLNKLTDEDLQDNKQAESVILMRFDVNGGIYREERLI